MRFGKHRRGAPQRETMNFTIDEMRGGDWEQVRAIYTAGIVTGDATFETEAPAWERWDASHLRAGRLVARVVRSASAGEVAGWAALCAVSGRCVYAGVAEVSVYVGQAYRGRGVGRALLEQLIVASEGAGIFPENSASVALHLRCGFREVGRRERVGRLHGRWRDTLLLERRSHIVGVD